MAASPSTCYYCKRDLAHERHVTPLEHAQLFGEEPDDYKFSILVKPSLDRVATPAAKERIAS